MNNNKNEVTVKELIEFFKNWKKITNENLCSIEISADGSGSIIDFENFEILSWDSIEEGIQAMKEGRKKEIFD